MNALFYLNKYLLKYKWHLFLGLLFIISSNYFGVYMPKIIDDAADELTSFITKNSKQNEQLWNLGIQFSLLYMGFSLLKGIFLFFTRQTIIVMSRNIEYDLKNEIFSKYQQLNISFYKQNRTGDLMNRISEDVSKVRMYLGPAIMYTLNVVVLFIMVVSFMLMKNAELTLYVLVPLPILSIIIYKVSSIINKKSETVQRKQSRITSFVQEAFSGIRVLKAYNRSKHFTDIYKEETENYKKASLSLALVTSLFVPAIVMLIGLSTLITIYLGGLKTINNELDYGDILRKLKKDNQAKDAYKDSTLYKTGQKALNYTQDALSVAGAIPVVGAVADVANTAISGARVAGSAAVGDKEATKKNAKDLAWNAAAIVPGAGQAATAAKFANILV